MADTQQTYGFLDGTKYDVNGTQINDANTVTAGSSVNPNAPVDAGSLNTSSLNFPATPGLSNPNGLVAGVQATTVGGTSTAGTQTPQAANDPAIQTGIDSYNAIDSATKTPEQAQAEKQNADLFAQFQADSKLLEGKAAFSQEQEQKWGVDSMTKQLMDLNQQIAQRTTEYNKQFEAAGNQPILQSIAVGQQAAIQRNKAIEIGALAAQQAALQGNIQLAQDRAQKAVDLQFEPIETRIKNAQAFLQLNMQNLSRMEQKQAQKMQVVLTEQQQAIERQKDARAFAMTNGISQPYYKIGSTVYRTSDGKAYGSPSEFFKDSGVSSFAQAKIQDVSQTITKDKLVGDSTVGFYAIDPSAPGGLRQVIAGTGKNQLVKLDDGSVLKYNSQNDTYSIIDPSGVNSLTGSNGNGSLVTTTDPNAPGVINGYDITSYATDPNHETAVRGIYNSIGDITDAATAGAAVKKLAPNSAITGQMIMDAANQFQVDPKLMIAIMQQDSSLGTKGLGAKGNNPGNVGNSDTLVAAGQSVKFNTLQDGVNAVAQNLAQRKINSSPNVASSVNVDAINRAYNAAAYGLPTQQQARDRSDIKSMLARGDYEGVKDKVLNAAFQRAAADEKKQQLGRNTMTAFLNDIRPKLEAFNKAGGDTGLLTGTEQEIMQKIGRSKNAEAQRIATEIMNTYVQYRRSLTGAQFSEKESAEYKQLFPGIDKVNLTNNATIDGLQASIDLGTQAFYETYMGGGRNYQELLDSTAQATYLRDLNKPSSSAADNYVNSVMGGGKTNPAPQVVQQDNGYQGRTRYNDLLDMADAGNLSYKQLESEYKSGAIDEWAYNQIKDKMSGKTAAQNNWNKLFSMFKF